MNKLPIEQTTETVDDVSASMRSCKSCVHSMVCEARRTLFRSLTLLQYADIDSESEMLGYGISIILLNIGMYFVAPAVLLSVCIRKIHKN